MANNDKLFTRRDYLRAVVWPREPVKKTGAYRYVIVGMLITDTPLMSMVGQDEVVIDGLVEGLGLSLDVAPSRKSKIVVGDATHVLLNLERL